MKKIILIITSFTTITAYADDILLMATSNPVLSGCKINHRCSMNGKHDIRIVNDSYQTHTYKYNYMLCVKRDGIYTDCNVVKNIIDVAPRSIWLNHYDSHTEAIFGYASTYSFIVETEVRGTKDQKIINKYSIKVDR